MLTLHVSRIGAGAIALAGAVLASASTLLGADSIYVSSRGDNAFTAYDPQTLETSWSIDATLGMHEIAISPDGRYAIGAAYGSGPGHQVEDQRVAVIDLTTQELAHVIDVGHPRPNDIYFIDDTRALVTAEKTAFVLEVDVKAGEVVREIDLNGKQSGHMMCAHAETNRAYVAHVAPGLVSVIDLAKGAVIKTIETQFGSEGAAVTPDGKALWVTNHQSQSISIIDTDKLEVIETIVCEGFPFRIRITPDGERVVVSNAARGTLEV